MIKARAFVLLMAMLLIVPMAHAGKSDFAGDGARMAGENIKNSTGNLPPGFFTADAPTVVAKMLKAYGGRAAIAMSQSLYAKGRVFDVADEKYYTYTHYVTQGEKLRIGTIVNGRTEVQVLNGWRSFSGIPGMVRYTLKDMALKELRFEYLSLTLPQLFAQGSYKASYLGTASLDGRLVYSLMVELENAPVLGVELDAKTGLILKVSARLEHNKETLLVERRFAAYAEMNRTMQPKRIFRFRDGVLIERVEVFRYTPNPSISGSLFR